ncbi:hypothetical protein [Microbacterium caowuchunii]|uniref:Uncharacterized protein n=1 Tax=Microbacterium caowuchunii TaxID=2614638 RepID=A0A5N0TK76_9MICO|nr:hypothetical protein [Microbacterium caowuchunii]KAA9133729.1 hypothetical protein F6B40_08225 [Microbacterium caowuchunii]
MIRPLVALTIVQIAVFLMGMTCAVVCIIQSRVDGWAVLAFVAFLLLVALTRFEEIVRKATP